MTTTTAPALLLSASVKRVDKEGSNPWNRNQPRSGKVRVFVTLDHPFPEPTGPKCPGGEGAKCGRPAGECREVDHKVWTNEYLKPGLAEQRALLAEALGREEFEALGKLTFSSRAGCSMCPCSPGFVAEAKGTQDLHVTLEVAPR